MKKGYLVAGVGVVIVSVGVWFVVGKTPPAVQESSQTYTDENSGVVPTLEPQPLSGQDTIANLSALGRTLECSFQFKDVAVGSEGTGFFDGKNIRIDSMYTDAAGVVYTSNMISDGTTMYVWSKTEVGEFALKLPVPPEGVTSNTEPVDQSKTGLNPQQKVSYTCKPWNVDGSVFVPPASISFKSMNDLIPAMSDVVVPKSN